MSHFPDGVKPHSLLSCFIRFTGAADLSQRLYISFSWRKSLFVLAAFVAVVSSVAMCQGNGYALMVEKSPAAGGVVTPGIGVRQTSPNETILLNASPTNGYRFLYWLGDVENPTKTHTSVQVDSPKLVVAVFERVDYESSSSSSGSPSQAIASISGGGGRGGGGGGGGGYSSYPPGVPSEETPSTPLYVPVPEVPEPGTILLLGGGLAMLRSWRKGRKGNL